MHIKNKRGQSTVEYVLLVTAVVAVMIAFVTGTQKGGFQQKLNSTLNDVTGDMGDLQTRLVSPYGGTNAASNSTTPYSVNVVPGASSTGLSAPGGCPPGGQSPGAGSGC